MSSEPTTDELAKIRRKYYDNLDTLERQEKLLEQVETDLYQALSRLSVVAGGWSDRLDSSLDGIRRAIKERQPGGQLLRLIEDAATDCEGAKPNPVQARESRPPEGKPKGFLGRLLSNSNDDTNTGGSITDIWRDLQVAVSEKIPEIDPDLSSSMVIPDDARSAAGALVEAVSRWAVAQSNSHAEKVRDAAAELVDALEIPEVLATTADKVRSAMDQVPFEVDKTLNDLTTLVTSARVEVARVRGEFQEFLSGVLTKLGEIDAALDNPVKRSGQWRDASSAMHGSVNQEMEAIRGDVAQANDLGQLRAAMGRRLKAIEFHMGEFQKAQSDLIQVAETESRELRNRLQEVEVDSKDLREKLVANREMALTDGLTGIFNRIALDERLALEFSRWKRYPQPLSLMFWDIDYFKTVNDSYGHQAGDKVLQAVARLLKMQVREADFVARYGGEEFVVLMPQTDTAAALTVAENIRNRIERSHFKHKGERVPITASCGIAEFGPEDTPEAVCNRADAALYQAKRDGRNRCCGPVAVV